MSENSLVPAPSERFGELFKAVQSRRLFRDSKTFADAVPRREPDAIMADWAATDQFARAALEDFVASNFELPQAHGEKVESGGSLADHIERLWPRLTRRADTVPSHGSALQLPRPFIVPGGRFRELYYWDTYFTLLGHSLSGRQDVIEDHIANFGSLLDRFGHIPNASRSYYLSRSHPPVFFLVAGLSPTKTPEARQRRLALMCKEHAFWMDGERDLAPGGESRRVVRLADGSLLNRYWDDSAVPRDESWIEDVELAQGMNAESASVLWRNIRAAAESGWDFSSRWLGDGRTLSTIRTTRIVPIDLNSLLFGLEQAIATEAAALGQPAVSQRFAERAEARALSVNRHLWNATGGFYADYDLDLGAACPQITAAAGFPLFCGLASSVHAGPNVDAMRSLIRPHGLLTTLIESGQQWDAPNGWAPLQWIACEGLRRYGEHDLAKAIARGWTRLVAHQYAATGQIFEKYDLMAGRAGSGGEYAVEIGFGWTNGVTLALQAYDIARPQTA